MLPRRALMISGIAFLFIGFVVFLNSFQGITGLVVLEGVDVQKGYYVGGFFVIAGLILVWMAHRVVYNTPEYRDIAGRIYDKLGTRNAYWHHTEKITDIEKAAAGEKITPRKAREVIMREVEEGRLNLYKDSISISRNREKLEEVLNRYGGGNE
jgi:S-adenosylmethionine/arginine decarboxylase-like enzyme